MGNVLCYKGDLTTEQVTRALGSLFAMDLDWIAPTGDLMAQAVQIARRRGITVYDAVFVALAKAMQAPLVTADDRLTRQAQPEATVHLLSATTGGACSTSRRGGGTRGTAIAA